MLVAAAQRGERDALEALLRRHADRMLTVCRRITCNEADAADALQEAMVAVVRGIGRFDGRAAFGTWAHRVAANAALDEVRRRNRRAVPDDGLHTDDTDHVHAAPRDPDTRLDVEDALRTLPVDFRAAVVLRDLCGLDYAEIGELLGVPGGTVRSRIARGRAALVPHLTALDGGGNPAGPAGRPTERHG